MSKHTPWPWELDESSNIVKGADGSIVCADGTGAFIAIPNDADARLIAAAPELLEALKTAFDALEEIALAGMSGTGQETKEAMTEWHARRAWQFIGIAARAKDTASNAIAKATGAQS